MTESQLAWAIAQGILTAVVIALLAVAFLSAVAAVVLVIVDKRRNRELAGRVQSVQKATGGTQAKRPGTLNVDELFGPYPNDGD